MAAALHQSLRPTPWLATFGTTNTQSIVATAVARGGDQYGLADDGLLYLTVLVAKAHCATM
jgi:hypothetical protein